MRLMLELAAEHELIERVAFSLRTWARRARTQPEAAADGLRFLRFFREYAGRFHHAREEDVLLPALQQRAELPGDRGPIRVILEDHRRMEGLLDRLEALVAAGLRDEAAAEEALAVALRYSEDLWHHIDAENSVLFPQSEQRLRRHGVGELEGRAPSAEEAAARADGETLLVEYSPTPEPEVMRGDGCIACPAYGSSCRGLEHEWWNEWEWEEFADHLPSG